MCFHGYCTIVHTAYSHSSITFFVSLYNTSLRLYCQLGDMWTNQFLFFSTSRLIKNEKLISKVQCLYCLPSGPMWPHHCATLLSLLMFIAVVLDKTVTNVSECVFTDLVLLGSYLWHCGGHDCGYNISHALRAHTSVSSLGKDVFGQTPNIVGGAGDSWRRQPRCCQVSRITTSLF